MLERGIGNFLEGSPFSRNAFVYRPCWKLLPAALCGVVAHRHTHTHTRTHTYTHKKTHMHMHTCMDASTHNTHTHTHTHTRDPILHEIHIHTPGTLLSWIIYASCSLICASRLPMATSYPKPSWTHLHMAH